MLMMNWSVRIRCLALLYARPEAYRGFLELHTLVPTPRHSCHKNDPSLAGQTFREKKLISVGPERNTGACAHARFFVRVLACHIYVRDTAASRSHAFSGEEKAWCTAFTPLVLQEC